MICPCWVPESASWQAAAASRCFLWRGWWHPEVRTVTIGRGSGEWFDSSRIMRRAGESAGCDVGNNSCLISESQLRKRQWGRGGLTRWGEIIELGTPPTIQPCHRRRLAGRFGPPGRNRSSRLCLSDAGACFHCLPPCGELLRSCTWRWCRLRLSAAKIQPAGKCFITPA